MRVRDEKLIQILQQNNFNAVCYLSLSSYHHCRIFDPVYELQVAIIECRELGLCSDFHLTFHRQGPGQHSHCEALLLPDILLHQVVEDFVNIRTDAVIVEGEVGDAKELVEVYEFHHPQGPVVLTVQGLDTQPKGFVGTRRPLLGSVLNWQPGKLFVGNTISYDRHLNKIVDDICVTFSVPFTLTGWKFPLRIQLK